MDIHTLLLFFIIHTRTRTIPTAPYPISEKRTECTERDIERISLGGINIVFEDEMIEKILSIKNITTVYTIDTTNLKSKNNLIF